MKADDITVTAKSAYTYEDLLECGHGRLFGPGNAQLPLPPMLMFDRIDRISEVGGAHGRGEVVASLDVRPDLWFFGCHFEGDPVMPGCLGLDALWQMTGFFLGWTGAPGRGRALSVGGVKFTGQVLPDAKRVEYRIVTQMQGYAAKLVTRVRRAQWKARGYQGAGHMRQSILGRGHQPWIEAGHHNIRR